MKLEASNPIQHLSCDVESEVYLELYERVIYGTKCPLLPKVTLCLGNKVLLQSVVMKVVAATLDFSTPTILFNNFMLETARKIENNS